MCNIAIYHLEEYLFKKISPRFHRDGELSVFDFFCIMIWKANRAKSKIAHRLLSQYQTNREDLDAIIRDMTRALHRAKEPRERLRILVKDWGFMLPMATAILTVLWPDDFTIYDVRVCNTLLCKALRNHHNLQNKTNFSNLWSGYQKFKSDVEAQTPPNLLLRDKDRYLWGESFKKQLIDDIKTRFSKKQTTDKTIDSDKE